MKKIYGEVKVGYNVPGGGVVLEKFWILRIYKI